MKKHEVKALAKELADAVAAAYKLDFESSFPNTPSNRYGYGAWCELNRLYRTGIEAMAPGARGKAIRLKDVDAHIWSMIRSVGSGIGFTHAVATKQWQESDWFRPGGGNDYNDVISNHVYSFGRFTGAVLLRRHITGSGGRGSVCVPSGPWDLEYAGAFTNDWLYQVEKADKAKRRAA